MKKNLLLSISFACSFSIFAQEHPKIVRCSQMEHEEFLQKQNPNRLAERKAYQQELNKWIESHPYNDKTPQAPITIPVVVHVLWNQAVENISDAQVLSAIQVLNDDFNRTNADAANTPSLFAPLGGSANINWCMATVDPNGNPTNGIVHKQTTKTGFDTDDGAKKNATGGDDAWDVTKYFNIWVVKFNDATLLGYGEFPTSTKSNTYGFCATYTAYGTIGTATPPFDKGRTATHEIGHCFNLYHIWGDEAACAADDNISDTPQQKDKNFGTPTFPLGPSSAGGCCNAADQSSMFMNYMDYTDDAAMNIFTKEQCTAMLAVLNKAPYNALKNSTACSTTGINEVFLPENVSLYPNPSAGDVFINTHIPGISFADVTIYNAIGDAILHKRISTSSGEMKLDMNGYSGGMYFIQVKTTKGTVTKKVSITR